MDRLVFVTQPGAAPASRRLPLCTLAQWPLVLPAKDRGLRRTVDDACTQAGISLTPVAEIDPLPNTKKAVETGLAATILSCGAVSDEVRAGRLSVAQIGSPRLRRRVVVLHALTRPMRPAVVAVLQAAEDVAREMDRTKAWPARWVGE